MIRQMITEERTKEQKKMRTGEQKEGCTKGLVRRTMEEKVDEKRKRGGKGREREEERK